MAKNVPVGHVSHASKSVCNRMATALLVQPVPLPQLKSQFESGTVVEAEFDNAMAIVDPMLLEISHK